MEITVEIVLAGLGLIALFVWLMSLCFRSDND